MGEKTRKYDYGLKRVFKLAFTIRTALLENNKRQSNRDSFQLQCFL